jgi:hypothetical protein
MFLDGWQLQVRNSFPLKENGVKETEKYDRYKGRKAEIRTERKRERKESKKEKKESDEGLTHKRNYSR